jgi:plasmid stabilization system protein ParE
MARLLLVFVEAAEVAQRRIRDIFRHLHRHAGVAQAHDRHGGQGVAVLEQGVGAGAHQEDRLHAAELREQDR